PEATTAAPAVEISVERRWRGSLRRERRRSSTTASEKAGDGPGALRRAGPLRRGTSRSGALAESAPATKPPQVEGAVFNAASLCTL
ncbi:MAG: hypothetical protein ACO2PN_14145, partial [Pyrobaculum sp.]